MIKKIFPSGLTVDLSNLDLEMTVQYFQNWSLESEQMQKGKFSATISAIHTSHIQLHDVNYSHGFMTQGGFPEDCVMLGYVKTKAKVSFQNRVLEVNELVISTEGGEVYYTSNGENDIFTISVEKQLFVQAFFDYFGEPFDMHQKQSRFFIKPHMLQLFLEGIKGWMTFLKANQHLLLSEDKYNMIESEILRDIFACLVIGSFDKTRSKFQVEKARELLHAKLNESISISSLIHELDISERQLERVFKSNYGITPKRYLLNLRMNAARKELLLSDPATTTISTIILKYNFFDLSHFSRSYKILFGELPSQTHQK